MEHLTVILDNLYVVVLLCGLFIMALFVLGRRLCRTMTNTLVVSFHCDRRRHCVDLLIGSRFNSGHHPSIQWHKLMTNDSRPYHGLLMSGPMLLAVGSHADQRVMPRPAKGN